MSESAAEISGLHYDDPDRNPLPGWARQDVERRRANGEKVIIWFAGPSGPDAVDVASPPPGMEAEVAQLIAEEREAYFADFPEMRALLEGQE